MSEINIGSEGYAWTARIPEVVQAVKDRYRGLSLEEAVAMATTDGEQFRVIRPGDVLTEDYRPSRVDFFVDEEGNLDEVSLG